MLNNTEIQGQQLTEEGIRTLRNIMTQGINDNLTMLFTPSVLDKVEDNEQMKRLIINQVQLQAQLIKETTNTTIDNLSMLGKALITMLDEDTQEQNRLYQIKLEKERQEKLQQKQVMGYSQPTNGNIMEDMLTSILNKDTQTQVQRQSQPTQVQPQQTQKEIEQLNYIQQLEAQLKQQELKEQTPLKQEEPITLPSDFNINLIDVQPTVSDKVNNIEVTTKPVGKGYTPVSLKPVEEQDFDYFGINQFKS